MKLCFLVALLSFCAAGSVFAEPSEKEIVALMNRVQRRVAEGDIKALDDLSALPGKWAVPAFLTIFKQTYSVSGATPVEKAIGARAAQLATTTSGAEEYLVQLLKGKPANNYVFFQQDSAIKCLVLMHNDTSVRILGGSLGAVDEEEIGPKVTRALTSLNLPGAPISPKDKVKDTDALAKWKQWWDAHKSDFTSKPASPSPVP